MGRRVTNRDVGLSRPPSAYALFCAEIGRVGIAPGWKRRLYKKTPVKTAQAMQMLWKRRPDLRAKFYEQAQVAVKVNRAAREAFRRKIHEDADVTEDVPVAAEGRSSGKATSVATSELQFHWSHGEGLHLGHLLGSGTYGTVFSAKFLGMCFAVKVPRKTSLNLSEAEVAAGANAAASPMALRDVAREFQVLCLLGGHPNVVKAYAVLTSTSGQPGLVMEAAESSFDQWMRLAKLPTSPTPAANEIWLRLVQILHGLTYLHEKCILHCDLKESNLLCFPQGRMALADLGISRWLTEDSVICRGDEVYTLDYRPVEALHARASKVKLLKSADVWAFGIIVWKAFADSQVSSQVNFWKADPRTLCGVYFQVTWERIHAFVLGRVASYLPGTSKRFAKKIVTECLCPSDVRSGTSFLWKQIREERGQA
eukprot:s3482_g7.t1